MDVVFLYNVTTGNLGQQANVLASGTFNAVTVFTSITYPTPGPTEAASTVTPVRADTGTLLITPTLAQMNTTTTTAGSFFSVKFTPSAPISWNTDLKQLFLNVAWQTAATTTITNSPGVLVHIRSN